MASEKNDVKSILEEYRHEHGQTIALMILWDGNLFWHKDENIFQIWEPSSFFWENKTVEFGCDQVTYYHKKRYKLKLHATKENIQIPKIFGKKIYRVNDYQILTNWRGKYGYYSGLAVLDNNKIRNNKILSVWNYHANSPFLDSYYEEDDDLIWMKQVAPEFAAFLGYQWIDKLHQ
ncbi:MAG: hypothetical protein LBQ54_01380 [Planctomycetaceae bacterium]|nr:hypothetical protein [Planctomycetaceae bacterium]